MSMYEQRLAKDKDDIRRRVSDVGSRVSDAVQAAVDALLARDEAACGRIILGDLPINREVREIDKLCHAFVARHLPSAGHLRFVSSVLQMNVALERVGDYAATIAREGVQLSTAPPPDIAEEMRQLGKRASALLRRAVTAFTARDEELARATKPQAKALDDIYARAFQDLASEQRKAPVIDLFAFLTVFHRLGRVSDQAKNICEETLFELTGETKPPKRYRVLFVDARATLVAPLAVALARKSFPESGSYELAGFQAGDTLAPELRKLGADLALDLTGIAPARLDISSESLRAYHVIVCLSREARRQFTRIPFDTVVLVWDLPSWSEGPSDELDMRLKELSHHLSSEIHELMVTMRGEGAS